MQDLMKVVDTTNATMLTKDSDNIAIENYFIKILELNKNGNQFPINLDEVWKLVYDRKDSAIKALRYDFMQDVDYQVSRQDAENSVGRPADIYMISTSCLEFFIARKVRDVFEVYRKVFHHTMNNNLQVPQTLSAALLLASKQAEQIEQQQLQLEVQAPKVEFYDAVMDSKDTIDMKDVANTLDMGIGRNNLFEFLRKRNVLAPKNRPYQRYVDAGWFRTVELSYQNPNGDTCINIKTVVFQKGIKGIRKMLIDAGFKHRGNNMPDLF